MSKIINTIGSILFAIYCNLWAMSGSRLFTDALKCFKARVLACTSEIRTAISNNICTYCVAYRGHKMRPRNTKGSSNLIRTNWTHFHRPDHDFNFVHKSCVLLASVDSTSLIRNEFEINVSVPWHRIPTEIRLRFLFIQSLTVGIRISTRFT